MWTSKGINDREHNYFLFEDRNNKECSLTQSTLNIENVIWFGVEKPRILTPKGLATFPSSDIIDVESRMLLTREQVKALDRKSVV